MKAPINDEPRRAGRGTFGAGNEPSLYANYTPILENGQRVGGVYGDIFKKNLRGSKHFFRRPAPAIALGIESLRQAEKHGAAWVEITDDETGNIYRLPLDHIWQVGERIDFPGYGPQIRVVLSAWIVQRRGGALQLGLFGGAK